jgi:hypothetical protein
MLSARTVSARVTGRRTVVSRATLSSPASPAESRAARRAASSSSAALRATESPADAIARAALSVEATVVHTPFTSRAVGCGSITMTGPIAPGSTDGRSR